MFKARKNQCLTAMNFHTLTENAIINVGYLDCAAIELNVSSEFSEDKLTEYCSSISSVPFITYGSSDILKPVVTVPGVILVAVEESVVVVEMDAK